MNNKSLLARLLNPRLLHLRARLRASLLLRLACCLAAATATVIGCGWSGMEPSVRFNIFQTEREMGRLLPLPTLANGKTEARQSWDSDDYVEAGPSNNRKHVEETDALWDKAEAAERQGDLQLTRTLLREYLTRTAVGREGWFTTTNRQQRRNSAIDRMDAMTALDGGTRAIAIQSYLAARRAFDNPKVEVKAGAKKDEDKAGANEDVEQAVEQALSHVPPDEGLRDNVAYLRAASLYRKNDYSSAAAAFRNLTRQHSSSEKREAALYMAALSVMKSSKSFTATSGDEAHLEAGSRRYDSNDSAMYRERAEPTPIAECCDDAWREARDAFARVLALYPRGRYSADARGWIAYLLLRANDRAGALVEYYRLLGDKQDRNARIEAAFSLTLVRHHATVDEMRRVEAELEDEPAAALAYAYHNIYNYAINPGCSLLSDYPDSTWEAEWKEERKDSLKRAEFQHVVAFASRMMQRYPRAGIDGQFAVRVAGANLELGENRLAAEQAARALAMNINGEERARALWLKGVAEHRLHDYTSATLTLSKLVAENPQGEFTEGARRMLAMIAEDAGDIAAALEQYLSLEYSADVAYFIEVLMTPEQLSAFIERHPDLEKRDELLYALGVRYMRARRWDEARAAFARVHTLGQGRTSYNYGDYGIDRDCYHPPGFDYRCNDPKQDDTGPGVTARLLLSEIRTIDELQRLERAVEQAQGDEAKAEALYQLASYQYSSSTLLFYNPIARASVPEHYRAPGEAEKLWREMQERAPMARALVIYLDIARRFPQTRAARDALYTAAVCHERLSNYNVYWRSAYVSGLHAGDRMVTYKDVKATYPLYQLPRGTYRWEPVTRTVNGGPGWAAPPKPQPRLTRRERLKLLSEKLWGWLVYFWKEKARPLLLIVLTLFGALLATRFAARSRKLLREHVGRRRVKRRPLRRWLAAYRAGQLKYVAGDEVHALAKLVMHQSLRLALHPRGRSILALNLLAHALLIVLVVAVVETLHPG